MTSSMYTLVRYSIVLLISVILVSGCSGSSDSSSPNSQLPSESGSSTPFDDSGATTGEGATAVSETDVNPVQQNVTSIEFTIAVPAYMSDSLQLRIDWGEFETNAAWVGDEIWSATISYPTSTEHLLTVTFFDGNGAVELGTFEQLYRTGANSSEAFQITADQFDTTRWDTDKDGISNIDELIAGTNPLQEDHRELELRESLDIGLLSSIQGLESALPEERPYVDASQTTEPATCEFVFDCTTTEKVFELDSIGSGTMFLAQEFIAAGGSSDQLQEFSATRTVNDASITWSGSHSLSSFWAVLWEHTTYNIVTEKHDGFVRRQAGGVSYVQAANQQSEQSNPRTTLDITYNLWGRVIDGSMKCESVAGSVQLQAGGNSSWIFFWPRNLVSRTATKQMEDQYWTIRDVYPDEQPVQEYWVESIGTFYCQFADL